jgi:hypothetical protein
LKRNKCRENKIWPLGKGTGRVSSMEEKKKKLASYDLIG